MDKTKNRKKEKEEKGDKTERGVGQEGGGRGRESYV